MNHLVPKHSGVAHERHWKCRARRPLYALADAWYPHRPHVRVWKVRRRAAVDFIKTGVHRPLEGTVDDLLFKGDQRARHASHPDLLRFLY